MLYHIILSYDIETYHETDNLLNISIISLIELPCEIMFEFTCQFL